MQPGDIAFVRGTGFPSPDWWIRLGERLRFGRATQPTHPAWWNHAAIVVADGTVIEARASGIVQHSITDEGSDWQEYIIVRPPYEAGRAQNAVDAATAAVTNHEHYDWLMILSEAVAMIFGARLFFGVTGSAICSGQVSYDVTRANVDVGDEPQANSPAKLFSYALQNHWEVVAYHGTHDPQGAIATGATLQG